MGNEELYPYTKEELIRQMKRLAAAYTPEWKFDETHPDVGTALALIYADMFYDTVRRYNRIPEKNRAAFFNSMGTRLQPSIPSGGYVSFALSSKEYGGAYVPKGFAVTAQESGKEGMAVPFETQDSVYVAPSDLETLFLTDGDSDRIQQMGEPPFGLFQSTGENLQEHMFFLAQDEVLHLKGPAEICIRLTPYRFLEKKEEYLQRFLKEEEIALEYGTSQGFVPFGGRREQDGCLILQLKQGQPGIEPVEFQGREGCFIRCRYLKPYIMEPFVIEELRLTSRADQVFPDVVQTEAGEEGFFNVFPFGEKPSPYSEVYIASDQVLSKAGAKVHLSFTLDYERIPTDADRETERDWKLVMKRTDFTPDPEYDITIERVIWEYYNGTGWSRLFDGLENSHVFNGGDGTMGQKFSISFTCPADAKPFLYNSTESRYIRIRVLKMNNLFKIKGNYITPVMGDILFSFAYEGQGRIPDLLETVNNLEHRAFPVRTMEREPVSWPLFAGLGHRGRRLYLKFTQGLEDGPMRILFSMGETFQGAMPPLSYEYLGTGGFRNLPVMDQTEHMRKSGTLTFMGRPDFVKAVLWGEEGFWLRIVENEGNPVKESKKREPVINGIHMNVARILAVQTMPEERFSIEPGQENRVCRLLHSNIHDLEVWVDELERLTESSRKRLEASMDVEEERDKEGRLTGFWVKWEEKEDFYLSSPEGRHYVADHMEGEVTFSDGRNGAIPPSGDRDTIRIRYRCGGGKEGNQTEEAINQMSRSLGYVNKVFNPCITTGGNDQETVDEAILRSSAALCHRGRAVTVRDYEALALEASRDVLKVKCFPNCSESGGREPGSVTLVVLQKNFQDGRLYFDQVKTQVERYMNPRLEGNQAAMGRFYVAEPRFLKLECRMEVVVLDFNDVFDVKKQVSERIREFLDPITGNFNKKGWEIGRIPNEVQIGNALKGIPGIHYIKELRMSAFMQSREGWIEVDQDSADLRRFAVAVNGSHQIMITVENG